MNDDIMRYPRWLMGGLRCDREQYLEALQEAIYPVRKLLLKTAFNRVFYDIYVPTREIMLYGAQWKLPPEDALNEFRTILQRESIQGKLVEFRRAVFYKGLSIEVFGGRLVIPIVEEFSHWGSWACLRYIRRDKAQTIHSRRYLFAMLISDVILNLLGIEERKKIRLLEEWQNALLQRVGEPLQKYNRQIPYVEVDKIYEEQKPLWTSIFLGKELNMEFIRCRLSRELYSILNTLTVKLRPYADQLKMLRSRSKLTKPFDDIVMRRLVHGNWLRLDIDNARELLFLHLLKVIFKSRGKDAEINKRK